MAVDLEGYRACDGCGELHPKILLSRLGGTCWDCLRRGLEPLRTVVLQVGPNHASYKVRRRYPTGTRGNAWAKRQVEKAKQDAYRQLRHFFPDLFDVLYAEARQARGLEPWYTTPLDREFSPEEYRATVEALMETWRARLP